MGRGQGGGGRPYLQRAQRACFPGEVWGIAAEVLHPGVRLSCPSSVSIRAGVFVSAGCVSRVPESVPHVPGRVPESAPASPGASLNPPQHPWSRFWIRAGVPRCVLHPLDPSRVQISGQGRPGPAPLRILEWLQWGATSGCIGCLEWLQWLLASVALGPWGPAQPIPTGRAGPTQTPGASSPRSR
jgi:hypothetical protein